MTTIFESCTISVSIVRNVEDVYAFASVPENFPKWASGLGSTVRQVNGTWIAEGPDGPVIVRFSPTNIFGVLDHVVITAAGEQINIPLRVIANGEGSEVQFTLFRLPGRSDDEFEADAAWIRGDLNALKMLLEA